NIATVLLKNGRREDLTRRSKERLHIDLPLGSRRSGSDAFALLGIAPDSWLAIGSSSDPPLIHFLNEQIGDLAAISDQSHGYLVIRIRGSKARAVLQKIVPIDIHPRAFTGTDVASTVGAHVPVTLWRVDDAPDGTAMFELAVPRSFASNFCESLLGAASEFG